MPHRVVCSSGHCNAACRFSSVDLHDLYSSLFCLRLNKALKKLCIQQVALYLINDATSKQKTLSVRARSRAITRLRECKGPGPRDRCGLCGSRLAVMRSQDRSDASGEWMKWYFCAPSPPCEPSWPCSSLKDAC